MATLIVAFPKLEEAESVKSLLSRKGYDVAPACVTGAQVINQADSLSDGIIICGYKLADNMHYTELYEYKPKSFEMLLVASRQYWEECVDNGIVFAAIPIRVNDLVDNIELILREQLRQRRKRRSTPRVRSEAEKKIIAGAKLVLMQKNNMTEEEAFRYIQKCSMDSGNTMVEAAKMVHSIFERIN